MTHTKDEALKLALEALQEPLGFTGSREIDAKLREAITAIKQARAAPVQPEHISPKQLLALAQEANLGLDKVIEVFRMAAQPSPVSLTDEQMAKALPRPWPDEGDRVCLSPTELRQFARGIMKGQP